ncbi:MAG: STAS domain-containing protein [Clostridia bacterium]|nr:STAS domain-containing protein [Clostridia bacterium]
MTIKELRNDGILTVSLEGRLDTTTSPELDTYLEKNYPIIDKLIFDFSELSYMSSAGLRVMLKAQKAMTDRGGILIRNASKLVMTIFEVTGFTDVLQFE